MALPLTLSIAVAYLTSRKRQTTISVFGAAMGAGFFIAVAAMLQGFQNYFLDKVISSSPHVIMKDEYRTAPKQPVELRFGDSTIMLEGLKPKEELRGIRGGDRIASEIAGLPGVHVSAVLRGQALLRYGGKDVAASLVGITPHREARVSNLEENMVKGELSKLQTNSNGIILGSGIADNLGAKLGAKLTVVSPQGVRLVMKVEGITRTGITAIDYSEAYILLEKSQILQKRNNRVNLIKMRLDDANDANAIAEQLEARYGYRTEGWEETNENVFSLFRMQNAIMYSVVTAILIVSGFGIFNIISTVVNEKTRDIAILKSMGFGRRDIERIFLMQGIIVGIVGTIVGWMLGYALTNALEHIPVTMKKEGFIEVEHMLLYRSYMHYVISGILVVISATVSSLLPARKAARLNPVDIIRGAA